MKTLHLSKVGTSEYTVKTYLSKKPDTPEGFIEMGSPKPPDSEYVSQSDGTWLSVPKSAGEKVAAYREEVSAHIDSAARALGFDSVVTAVTYADEPSDPLNHGYGVALRAWRSACWLKCREDLTAWQDGGDEPTIEQVIAGLPKFSAP